MVDKKMEKEMKWKQLSEKLDLNDATLDYLISHLNKDRKEDVKMLLMYPFICYGLISYDRAAKILGIDVLTLLNNYDDFCCSTAAICFEEIRDLFVEKNLMTKEHAKEMTTDFERKIEYVDCGR